MGAPETLDMPYLNMAVSGMTDLPPLSLLEQL